MIKTVDQATNQPVTLTFWGVFDEAAIFEPLIANYQKLHPNVTINYVRQETSIYEFTSLNQLATQEGPDVWLIPSEWLPKHRDKFTPLPEGFLAKQNLPKEEKKGGLLGKKSSPVPTNAELYGQVFAEVTGDDNLVDGQVIALPLSVDTLGLYANAALLEKYGVAAMPRTWEDIVTAVKKITGRAGLTYDRPAIGLGTGNNVSRASEILATLLMQNHTPMIDSTKKAALYNADIAKTTGERVKPGPAALDFYTSFASPTKESYGWSPKEGQDFELFTAGQLPLMIEYSYRVNDIRQRVPGFPLATAPLPQVSLTDSPLTLGTSMMVGVPKVSRRPNQAWDFIQFLTAEPASQAYARAAGRPPARIALAAAAPSDPALAPFIAQIGNAKSWYRTDINAFNKVFIAGIEAVLAGRPVDEVIDKLTKQATHILRNEPYE